MDTEDRRYNGWTNYETWSVALIVDNEEPLYRQRCRMADAAWVEAGDDDQRPTYFTRSQQARYTLADRVRTWVRDELCDIPERAQHQIIANGLVVQLLGGALDAVDWSEIASNWLSDIDGYERDGLDA